LEPFLPSSEASGIGFDRVRLPDLIIILICYGLRGTYSLGQPCWPLEVTVPLEKYQIENQHSKLPVEKTQ